MASTFFCASPRWPPSSGAATCSRRKSRSSSARRPCSALPRKLVSQLPRGARHVDHLQPGERAEAAHQVGGRHHRALDAEALAERRQRAPRPLPPEPDRVRRAARRAPGAPRDTGCCRSDVARARSIRLRRRSAPGPVRQRRADRLVRDQRAAASCACPARRRARPAGGGSRCRRGARCRRRRARGARSATSARASSVGGRPPAKSRMIAAPPSRRSSVTRLQRNATSPGASVDAAARRLDRGAAAADSASGRSRAPRGSPMSLAAGGPARQRARQAEDAARRHAIEVRRARHLQRRLAAQLGDRLVGHPVAHARRRTSWAHRR